MAQIPYSPVPDVTSQYAATPEVHVNAPEAGFGGAVASALIKAGTAGTEASNELFQRAQAMQQLDNETNARKSSIDFATKADQRVADFKTQFGQNAGPEQYAQFQKDIADLREQTRKNLTSPMSQKMFDADAASITINSLKYGAFHSAEQLKQSAMTTNKMAVDTIKNGVLAHPEDEAAYNDGMAKAKEHAETNAQLQGWDEATTKAEVAKAQSDVTKQRITGLANNGDILSAKKAFDDANGKNSLTGEDRSALQKFLNTQENTHGSRVVVDNTRDGTNLAIGQGPVDMDRAKIGIKAVEGGDYGVIVNIKHTNAAATPDRAIGAYQILESNLPKWLSAAGLPSMTAEEFAKNPSAQDKVFETQFGQDMAKNGFNAAADHWLGTGKADANGTTHSAYLAKANAAMWKGSSLEQRVAAAKGQASTIAPENKEFPDFVESHVITDYNHEKAEEKAESDHAQSIISSAIQEQVSKGPVTLSNLMKTSPEFAAIYEKMPLAKQLQLAGQLKRLSAQDNNITPAREEAYNKLQGQALAVDPEGFKSIDFTNGSIDLAADQRKSLITLQQKMIAKNVVPDPAFQGAIRDPEVIATADSVGAGPKSGENWKTFTGALAEEIKFARATGKTIDNNTVQDMANKLVQVRAGSGIFGGTFGGTSEYRMPLHAIPEAQQEQERKFLAAKFDRDPTDQEIEHLHAIRLYQATQTKRTANAGQ